MKLRAQLTQCSTKPAKHNNKGDLVYEEYANINFFVDMTSSENRRAINQLNDQLDGRQFRVIIEPLQTEIPGVNNPAPPDSVSDEQQEMDVE